MEKIKSTYWFSNPYKDSKLRDQTATVVLEINYRNASFSILPHIADEFKFKEGRKKEDVALWVAVIKSIEDAIDFVLQELPQ